MKLARRPAMVGVILLCAVATAGCFDKPEIEDRWTRMDLISASTTPFQAIALGAPESLSVSADLIYRRIITGYAVAELRASSTVLPTDVNVAPGSPRLTMAQDIDRILQNSVSIGRATRAITGWDHLIQRLDMSFSATLPAVVDTATGAGARSVFLLMYLASGEEIERNDGSDTLIITPFPYAEYELLPVGMEFTVPPPTPGNQ